MARRQTKYSKPTNHWIGARLARIRRHRRMTQEEMGHILDRTDSAVSDMENGYSDITLDQLMKMAEGLGLPLAGLLLPDPGAPAPAPHQARSEPDTSPVVHLLSDEARVALLSRILERLPQLEADTLAQVAVLVNQPCLGEA